MTMKFVVFWEYNSEDLKTVIEKFLKLEKLNKKNPQKYPTNVSGPFLFTGEFKGITVCEAENDEQIVNFHKYCQPEVKLSFFPVNDLKTTYNLIFHSK